MSPKNKRDIIWDDNIHLLLNAHKNEDEENEKEGSGGIDVKKEKFQNFKI